jgi:hypothetical protein
LAAVRVSDNVRLWLFVLLVLVTIGVLVWAALTA